jgi:putative protein-disulfide isomerase
MAAVQSAFYAHNRDVTDTATLAEIADAQTSLGGEAFTAEFMAPDTRNETFRDFMIARQAGVEGFPCLAVGNEGAGYALVSNGFRPLDGLPEAIEDWLAKGAPTSA